MVSGVLDRGTRGVCMLSPAMKEDLPGKRLSEPGDGGASDVAGLSGTLCDPASSGPKYGSPALLKSWLAQIALYPSHTLEALGYDGLA